MKRRYGNARPGRKVPRRDAGRPGALVWVPWISVRDGSGSVKRYRLVWELTAMRKATVLRVRVPEWHPGIDRSPDVCGGSARIIRTRVPVWALEAARRAGFTEADLLRSYPTLRAQDLVHAWSYAAAHPDEIDREVRENEDA